MASTRREQQRLLSTSSSVTLAESVMGATGKAGGGGGKSAAMSATDRAYQREAASLMRSNRDMQARATAARFRCDPAPLCCRPPAHLCILACLTKCRPPCGPQQKQVGAYQAGRPATHVGKISYPECRTPVHPPSAWDPALAERSARPPELGLTLDFVYGCVYGLYVLYVGRG
jgi:hypothetical protein